MQEIEENKIKISLKKDYNTPIKDILSASSLAYLLSPFRSIWSLFLFIFLLLSIYYVTLNILDYLKYDTITSIYTINEQVFLVTW